MQLSLPVSLPADETFDSFVSANNRQLVTLLREIGNQAPYWQRIPSLTALAAQPLPLINLFGGSGQGKSHLLYATAHMLSARQVSHIYLNLQQHAAFKPCILDGLEVLHVIALDNIHAISKAPAWEEALFDLINRVTENRQTVLLFSARQPPRRIPFNLPDLQSRLQWGTSFAVHQLNDNQRKQALILRSRQKGLQFSDAAIAFLLHHYDRNLTNLMQMLERLDTRSLQEQRRISVALIKRELSRS